ncbi:hypothetical protein SK875_p00195 (plasmid) [Burkholderia contaminans]|nr:hypothetical protein SK875_p00195 [Burkholderia contaminans]
MGSHAIRNISTSLTIHLTVAPLGLRLARKDSSQHRQPCESKPPIVADDATD